MEHGLNVPTLIVTDSLLITLMTRCSLAQLHLLDSKTGTSAVDLKDQ